MYLVGLSLHFTYLFAVNAFAAWVPVTLEISLAACLMLSKWWLDMRQSRKQSDSDTDTNQALSKPALCPRTLSAGSDQGPNQV